MKTSFEPIEFDHLPRFSSWALVQSFSPYNVYVNAKGQAVSGFYNGRAYFLVSELEKTFSLMERVSRVICALLTIVVSVFMSLAFSETRSFFVAEKERVRIGLLAHNLNAERTINGISTQNNVLETIDADCLEKQSCRVHECKGEHPCVHMCGFKNEKGVVFQKKLNSVEIRDILEWSPSRQNINKRHFASPGKPICAENIRRVTQIDLGGFS